MKLVITLSSTLPDGIDDEELENLKEGLEQELRFSGAYGIEVEVVKS